MAANNAKPRRQFNFGCKANRKVCLKFEVIPFNFVVKLNVQIAEVQCYFTA